MKKLRVAVITTEFVTEKYFSGGVANHWYRLFKAIASLDHEVHIITLSSHEDGSFTYDGLQVHRVNVGQNDNFFQRSLNRISRYRCKKTVQNLNFSLKAYRKLKELHKTQPFDIAHFPNSYGCGLFTSFMMRIPYVVMISCYRPLWNEMSGVKRTADTIANEWIEWLQYRISPHVYGPSYTLKRILEDKVKIKDVRVIRTPIYFEVGELDTSVYDEHLKGKSYLLFFGRYQLHKGFHILAQALPKVLETYPDLHVVFVGLDLPSKLAPSMKEYAISINNKHSDRLVFLTQLPHDQLYPVIQGSRLVVLPSLIDNLPNTFMESIAFGKPVIGTIGASFDEFITDGKNGFLVPIGDVNALSDKIIEAWMHPNLETIGQESHAIVQQLAPEQTVQALLKHYEEVISSH